MPPTLPAVALPLFVPADRPDRCAKAFAAGAGERAGAEGVLAASPEGGAVAEGGAMVDAPVRVRAEGIRRRAAAGKGRAS